MVRYSIVFLVIALIATIEFVSGFTSVVVPGWHTEIIPPLMGLSIAFLCWLFILPLGYFFLERKNSLPSQKMVFIHLIMTLFFFVYSNGASLFYNITGGFFRMIVPLGLFAVGQLLFVFIFINNMTHASKLNVANKT